MRELITEDEERDIVHRLNTEHADLWHQIKDRRVVGLFR